MESVKKYRSFLFGLFLVIALLLGIAIAYLFKNGIFLQQPVIAVCLLLSFLVNGVLFYGALHVTTQLEATMQRKSIEKQTDESEVTKIKDDIQNTEHTVRIQISSDDALHLTDQCKNKEEFANRVLINFSRHIEIVTALFYARNNNQTDLFDIIGSFAYFSTQTPQPFTMGEGLAGQVVKNKKPLNLSNVPEGYVTIVSGLGNGSPRQILFIPLLNHGEVVGLLELAAFRETNFDYQSFFENECERISEQFIKFAK